MFANWTVPQLQVAAEKIDAILEDCCCLEELNQAKRRERGAWVKPGMAGSATELEKLLLGSYHKLEKEVIESLSGWSDDVTTGRLAQAKKEKEVSDDEESAALAYYELAESDRSAPIDRTRLAAILTLLLLFVRRHRAIAEAKAKELLAVGRKKALAEVKKTTLAEGPISKGLEAGVLAQFESDIARLEAGLRFGTARSAGLETIVKDALTVGEAAALLRRLFDGEEFRIGMFAEALVWSAWLSGYRGTAIELTRAALQANGVHLSDDLDTSVLSEDQLDGVPRYIWTGPEDSKACDPCLGAFNDGPIYALSPDDLISPEDRCAYGRACRHWYEMV